MLRRIRADDVLILLAAGSHCNSRLSCGLQLIDIQMLLLVAQIMQTIEYRLGLGQRDDLSLETLVQIFKLQWIAVVPGNIVSPAVSRVSIAVLLIEIFSVKRWFCSYLVIVSTLACSLAVALIALMFSQCNPVQALWDPVVATTAQCLSPRVWQAVAFSFQGTVVPSTRRIPQEWLNK